MCIVTVYTGLQLRCDVHTSYRTRGWKCKRSAPERCRIADGHDFSLTVTRFCLRPVPALLLLVPGFGRFVSSTCVCPLHLAKSAGLLYGEAAEGKVVPSCTAVPELGTVHFAFRGPLAPSDPPLPVPVCASTAIIPG